MSTSSKSTHQRDNLLPLATVFVSLFLHSTHQKSHIHVGVMILAGSFTQNGAELLGLAVGYLEMLVF